MILMMFALLFALTLVFSSKVLLSICVLYAFSIPCLAILNDVDARGFDMWDYIYNKIKRS